MQLSSGEAVGHPGLGSILKNWGTTASIFNYQRRDDEKEGFQCYRYLLFPGTRLGVNRTCANAGNNTARNDSI